MKRTTFARLASAIGLTALAASTLSGCALFGSTPAEETEGSVQLTVALVPDPPGASEFYTEQFDKFEEANPGITIKVIENPADQQLNAVQLMFQQGNGPDVYRAQGDAALDSFVDRGWALSLDDLETSEFLSRFGDGDFDPSVSGLHRDGHLYSLPLTWGDWSPLSVLVYNKDLVPNAPTTWSEFAEAARNATKVGDGKVYGTAPMSGQGQALTYFASTAAPYGILPNVNLATGQPQAASDDLVELVKMWHDLQTDGALEPGWESWDGSKAFTEFAAGRLAMYATPAWHIAEIRKLNPEMNMGIAAIPVPDSGRVAYSPKTSSFAPLWSASAKTKHPEETLKLMDFLASVDFYKAYYETFGTLTASEKAWSDAVSKNEDQQALVDVAKDTNRIVPNPLLLDNGAKDLWGSLSSDPELDWKQPALKSIINGSDYKSAAMALDDKVSGLMDDAESKDPGTRNALVVRGWNPLENYQAP